ncbi:MAG TPA: hypothetical protein VF195_02920 [Actinomycetota bacterium]
MTEEFPREERGRALGIVTAMNTLGGIAVGLFAFGPSVLSFDVSWRAYAGPIFPSEGGPPVQDEHAGVWGIATVSASPS